MSNLIPTPRTDKLGRVVIRHMRETPRDQTLTAGAIPTVALPIPARSYMDRGREMCERFVDIKLTPRWKSLKPSGFVDLFHWLEQTNQDAADTVERLFSSGTDTGRRLAAQGVAYMIEAVMENKYSDLMGRDKTFHLEVLELWNAGNLAEEVDCAEGFDFTYPSPVHVNDDLQESFSDSDWRGLAAFRLAFDATSKRSEISADQLAFIRWAGRQSEMDAVITIAKERQILDPETISALMSSPGSTTALRDGVL